MNIFIVQADGSLVTLVLKG